MVEFRVDSGNSDSNVGDSASGQPSRETERREVKGRGFLRKESTWRANAVPVLQGRTSFGHSIRRRPDGSRASGFSLRAKFQSEIKNRYENSFAARRKRQKAQERILVMNKSARVIDPKRLPLRPGVLAALLVYTSLVVPFEIAELPKMSITSGNWPVFVLNRLADMILLADLLLSFFLSVFDSRQNLWITNQSFIVRRYLKGWFLVDVIALLPYDLLPYLMPHARVETPGEANTTFQILAWLMLLRLMRLTRLFKLDAVFISYLNEVDWDYSLATLCKYSLYAVLFIHWLSCAWWYIAEMELLYDSSAETWMTVFFDGSRTVGTLDKYIASSYWSVMTAVTVGYGGPTNPKTRVEFTFNIIAMLVAAFAFGYIIGTVAAVMSTRGLRTQLMYQIMDDVSHFSEACNLPKRLRHKLEDYFTFRCTQAMDHDYHVMLLQTMSPALRFEVASIADAHWLSQLHVFKKAPEAMISRLSIAMQQVLYPPLETIFEVGDPIRRLFVIKRGIIVSAGRVRMAGHALGDEALLELYRSTYSARSMTYSEVNEIDVDTINEILEGYPKFKRLLRLYAVKKVFRSEVLAYAEAIRRLNQVEEDLRDVVRRKTMFMEKYDLAEADLDELIDGDMPSVSVEYIVKSLKETMPDTEGRIAHYMLKLGRIMGGGRERQELLLHSARLIQRNWHRFKARRKAEVAVRNGRLLTWATFMLKMAMGDPSSQAFWMNIAHRHLSNMGVETENDVHQLFGALQESGVMVEASALSAEIDSFKSDGWKAAKRLVPLLRMGFANDSSSGADLPSGGSLNLDDLSESPNPIMAVMMAIVKWNGRDVPSAINAEISRSKVTAKEDNVPRSYSRRVSELRWTTYRVKRSPNSKFRASALRNGPDEPEENTKFASQRDVGRRWQEVQQQQRRLGAVDYMSREASRNSHRRHALPPKQTGKPLNSAAPPASAMMARNLRASVSTRKAEYRREYEEEEEVDGGREPRNSQGSSLSVRSSRRSSAHGSTRVIDILMSSDGKASGLPASPLSSAGTNKYKGSRLSVENVKGGVAGGVHPALVRVNSWKTDRRASKY